MQVHVRVFEWGGRRGAGPDGEKEWISCSYNGRQRQALQFAWHLGFEVCDQ